MNYPQGQLDFAENVFGVFRTGDPRNGYPMMANNTFVLPPFQPRHMAQPQRAQESYIGFGENVDIRAPGVRDAKPGRSGAITTGWASRTDVQDNFTSPWINWNAEFNWLTQSEWMARRGAYLRQMLLDSDRAEKVIWKDTGYFTPSPYPFSALRTCLPLGSAPLL